MFESLWLPGGEGAAEEEAGGAVRQLARVADKTMLSKTATSSG
jgi:hypothetical protein